MCSVNDGRRFSAGANERRYFLIVPPLRDPTDGEERRGDEGDPTRSQRRVK